MSNGIIIESGALDGRKYSTTLLFEKFANWTAIHIGLFISKYEFLQVIIYQYSSEGDMINFRRLQRNRPNSININAALCNQSQLLHYVNVGDQPAVRGIYEYMSPAFINQWHKNLDINTLPVIHCVAADKLFSFLKIKVYDIWVLDVEGAEEAVLQVFKENS